MFIIVGYSLTISIMKFGNHNLLAGAFVIYSLGILLFIFTLNRLIQNLKFSKIETQLNKSENIELVEDILRKSIFLDFKKTSTDAGFFVNISDASSFSWGELTTIICEDNYILINSRPTDQPITVIENRLKVKRLTKEVTKRIKSNN